MLGAVRLGKSVKKVVPCSLCNVYLYTIDTVDLYVPRFAAVAISMLIPSCKSQSLTRKHMPCNFTSITSGSPYYVIWCSKPALT